MASVTALRNDIAAMVLKLEKITCELEEMESVSKQQEDRDKCYKFEVPKGAHLRYFVEDKRVIAICVQSMSSHGYRQSIRYGAAVHHGPFTPNELRRIKDDIRETACIRFMDHPVTCTIHEMHFQPPSKEAYARIQKKRGQKDKDDSERTDLRVLVFSPCFLADLRKLLREHGVSCRNGVKKGWSVSKWGKRGHDEYFVTMNRPDGLTCETGYCTRSRCNTPPLDAILDCYSNILD